MGLEHYWEAHCDKCAHWVKLPPGRPKTIALARGWRKFGTRWMCPECALTTRIDKSLQKTLKTLTGEDHGK